MKNENCFFNNRFIIMRFFYFILTIIFLAVVGFLFLYLFDKNNKIIQKSVVVEINFKDLINVCKSTNNDEDLSFSF